MAYNPNNPNGQATSANSAPVVISSDQSAVPVSAASLPLPSGAATAALQTQPGVDIGDVTVNNASGASAVNIQDGGNSITVDGTVTANAGSGTFAVSAATLPLPSGASTAALQTPLSQNTATLTNGSGNTTYDVTGMGTINIVTSGTWTGSLSWQGSMDGTTFSAVIPSTQGLSAQALTGQIVTSISGGVNDNVVINVAGLKSFRIVNSITTGTMTAYVNASLAPQLLTGLLAPVFASQLGTWTISGISGTVSLPTGASTAANQTSIIGTKAAGTAATNSMLAGAVYNSTTPTLTDGQQVALQADTKGNLEMVLPDVVVTGQSAQTATVNNILTATSGTAATDLMNYRSASVQVVSTGTAGTFIFEGSNDNSNFQTIPVYSQLILTGTPITAAITATATQLVYTFPVQTRYIRLRIATTITGGSIQAFSRFSQATWTPGIFQVAQATAANLATTATIASGTVTTVSTVTTLANGQTANSSASTGSPVRIGGRVITTLDTTYVQGDAADIAVTTGQQLLTKDFASSENDWQFVGTVTTTTQTAIKAAGAASIRNFVTCVTYQNTNATATTLNIQDGNTNILSISCAASMANPVQMVFPTPLRGTAATAINYTAGTTAANVLLNVQGYQSF